MSMIKAKMDLKQNVHKLLNHSILFGIEAENPTCLQVMKNPSKMAKIYSKYTQQQ